MLEKNTCGDGVLQVLASAQEVLSNDFTNGQWVVPFLHVASNYSLSRDDILTPWPCKIIV